MERGRAAQRFAGVRAARSHSSSGSRRRRRGGASRSRSRRRASRSRSRSAGRPTAERAPRILGAAAAAAVAAVPAAAAPTAARAVQEGGASAATSSTAPSIGAPAAAAAAAVPQGFSPANAPAALALADASGVPEWLQDLFRPSKPLPPPEALRPKGPHKEITVPQQLVARLIGRGGEIINRISQQSGAEIKVRQETKDLGYSLCFITGSPAAMEAAEFLVHQRVGGGGGSGGLRVEELVIPGDHVGGIIGPKGSCITDVRARAGGLQIELRPTETPGQGPYRATLGPGTPEQLALARRLLLERVASADMQPQLHAVVPIVRPSLTLVPPAAQQLFPASWAATTALSQAAAVTVGAFGAATAALGPCAAPAPIVPRPPPPPPPAQNMGAGGLRAGLMVPG